MSRPRPIEPREFSLRERVVVDLRDERIDPDACGMIADCIDACFGSLSESRLLWDTLRPELATAHRESETSGTIVWLLHWIQPERMSNDDRDASRATEAVIETATQGGIDWTGGFRRAAVRLDRPQDIAESLYRRRLIDLGQLLDLDTIAALSERSPLQFHKYTQPDRDAAKAAPHHVLFWIDAIGIAALEGLGQYVAEMDEERAIHLLKGIDYLVAVWQSQQQRHSEWFDRAGPEFARIMLPLFQDLDRRQALDQANDPLRRLWLKFAWMTFDADPALADAETKKRLLRAATDDLGQLRPLLRHANETDAAGEFRNRWEALKPCVYLLYDLDGVWNGLKALLLAFRALSTPSLASDLRYWNALHRDAPPEPWNSIPMSMVSLFHSTAGPEETRDPELIALRTEFASFCLARLKSKRNNKGSTGDQDEPVEPEAVWRECLIHAVHELRVNPGGKGHHVLHWLGEHDPDDDVRELAKKTYAALRHGPSLPNGLSPRRVIIHALWWLSQAHLLSLGVEIDSAGAQGTREEEVRRTTESQSFSDDN